MTVDETFSFVFAWIGWMDAIRGIVGRDVLYVETRVGMEDQQHREL